ncbi:MAG: transcriptional regulator [Treponema sp.]|nr:transcriptional regulator [Treponema sp.]
MDERIDHKIQVLQAAEDFDRAKSKAALTRIMNFINTDKDKLLSFNDVKDILKPKNQVYMGIQVIPVRLIVGSEGRYQDFNRFFLPKAEHLRARWERVDQAQLQSINLPPIQLYEIGGAYFVRDGNHRVSVAKSQGVESIDAEVISLSSGIDIKPNQTIDDLKLSLIKYEKTIFYEKTHFAELTGDNNLDFTATGRYDVIYNHILVHKYFINQGIDEEIPFDSALVSWYKNVYLPIVQIIKTEWIRFDFPGATPGDLYVWIVKHWDFLKKKYGIHYSLSRAARDFTVKYGDGKGKFMRFLSKMLGKVFKNKK